MKAKALIVLATLILPLLNAQGQYRTVIDKDAGSIFQWPNGAFPYSEYGAFDGSAPADSLDPNALQIIYGRLIQAGPSDETTANGRFPYSALRAYEAQQVAAGKAPLFVTATYQGKPRPVLFSWSLHLQNGVPTAPSQDWQYVMNVQDSGFVHFWINQYARSVLLNAHYNTPNVWIQLDECAFDWDLFGVLDDSNHFVSGLTWDSPFPQSSSAYLNSVASFFLQLSEVAPDIKVMPNLGTLSDPSEFPTIFANVPGVMWENIYGWHSDFTPYIRNTVATQNFRYFSWLAAQNRVAVLRAILPPSDANALVTSFVVYSLLKGPNFFFAPGALTDRISVPPSEWQRMKALLGSPTTPMQQQQLGKGVGFCLFWRNFEGGVAYLNWTGSTQTIQLSKNHEYWNPAGQLVTEVQVPDGTGTFVSTAKSVAFSPEITPRFASAGTGIQKITLESPISDAVLRFTEDGLEPTSNSPIYPGVIELENSAIIKARAFINGEAQSWSSTASYNISSGLPTVQFVNVFDSGFAGTFYPVLSLSGIPDSSVSVQYDVLQPDGSSSTGTATFLPGQVYRYFPITTSASVNQTATVKITSASGAIVGSKKVFSVTIQ